MKVNLKTYLATYFANVKIEPPLFYNAPIGIRFELGVPYREIEDPNYFMTVQLRAKIIFESLFDKDDEIILIVKTFKYVEPFSSCKDGDSVFSAMYIRGNVIDEAKLHEELPQYDEDDGTLIGYAQTFYISCLRSDIIYPNIIKAIGNQDFSIKPYITDGVYFIHPKRHVIFHMYDDRGLDMVANNTEVLKPIYTKFNHWILDYDREIIDRIFEG